MSAQRVDEGAPGASRLLADSAATPGASQPTPSARTVLSPVVLDYRRKFNLAMDDELLDYKHNHPIKIEDAANLLIKIFTNVLENPGEPKYRKIKATSNAFKTKISGIKGGENLMIIAGWTTKVVEYEKHWVFEGDEDPSSTKISILRECTAVLERALHTIHEKAERKRREQLGSKLTEEQRKQQVLLQLEDDRVARRMRAEATTLVTPVTACKLPSEEPVRQRPGMAPPGMDGEEEEEEDDEDMPAAPGQPQPAGVAAQQQPQQQGYVLGHGPPGHVAGPHALSHGSGGTGAS